MRRTVLAGAAMAALLGPARAFPFQPEEFAAVYDAVARLYPGAPQLDTASCDHYDRTSCTLDLGPGTVVKVQSTNGERDASIVSVLWRRGRDEAAPAIVQTATILYGVVCPRMTADNRLAFGRYIEGKLGERRPEDFTQYHIQYSLTLRDTFASLSVYDLDAIGFYHDDGDCR